ncbi:hypothetical protein DYY67_0628 [Candidatus Nitrosotalea sp. TS]|uniref:hypothetical protein n=1 Tax=Candidatus Nitrosotalea sp. TS TaxID=2341020 RepID=UPI00140A18EA|nr:hypothetical protein [Candidatus Nitrosotalea sp. TS]NHI02589.1 hypothetical protein [Candidatus Nitrosotalea sp. TS]
MKVLYFFIIAMFGIISSGIDFASADVEKSLIQVNGTQYEIDYKGTNVSVNGISAHFRSYYDNRLDLDITSSQTQNGSMSVSMSNEAAENIFCFASRGIGDIHNFLDFTVSTDKKYGEEFSQSSNFNGISLTFDIPAGAKQVTMDHMFVGMAVADPVQFSGIPEFGIYHQGERLNFTGIVQDGCNRRLSYSDIQIHAGVPSIQDMTTQAGKTGIFNTNFTIPDNASSGRYLMELDGADGNMSGKFFSTLLVEQNNETNVPYNLEDPRLGTFVIPYHLDGGEISYIGVDPISNLLDVRYYASHDTTLKIRIPSELMDFVGTINDTTTLYSGLRDSIPLIDHLDPQGDRVFTLPVTEGKDNVITIQGIHYGKDAGYDRQGVAPVRINDTAYYPVPYNITNGAFDITADPADNALKLRIETTLGDGHLHLVLPRKLIDSINGDGNDQNFTIQYWKMMDKTTPVVYHESQTSNNTRTLEIDFENGTSIMYIYGTYLVPEFPFAVPVLLIGITSLIVFYRVKFRQ